MKKTFFIALLLFLIIGCASSPLEEYNAELQMEIDINLIDEYLENNNIQARVHPSGVRYILGEVTGGEKPLPGDDVKVSYNTYLLDGTLVDTSSEILAESNDIFNPEREYGPLNFRLNRGDAIPGLEVGVYLMDEGGSVEIYVPSPLAYQNSIIGNIPPNSVLRFELELVDIIID